MSRSSTRSEIGQTLRGWADLYQPMSERDKETWIKDWILALQEIPYLRLMKREVLPAKENMLFMRCQLNFAGTKLEAVKADVERLWVKTLAKECDSRHAIVDVEGGFELKFLLLSPKKDYFTGTLLVVEAR